MQDLKKHRNRKQKRMKSRKIRKPTENQGKNTRKKKRRKSPKGENVRSISIILHPVMIVQTIALIQRSNIQKLPTEKDLVSTEIMTFHFLSMDIYQEATWHQRRVNITENLKVKTMMSTVPTVMTTLVATVRKQRKILPVS